MGSSEQHIAAQQLLDEEEVARLAQLILSRRHGQVVLDLSRVERCTTLGTWALTRLQADLEAEGRRIIATGIPPALQDALVAAGLDASILAEARYPVSDPGNGVLMSAVATPGTAREATRNSGLAATTSDVDTVPHAPSIPRPSPSASKVNMPPSGDHEGEERVDRLVRFYATRPVEQSGTTPVDAYLLIEAGEMGLQRRSRLPLRRRTTFEDVGFVRLDPVSALLPVAPQWSVVLDMPAALVRLILGERELFAVPEAAVPEVWRQSAAERGTCQLFAGFGLELEQDHPYLAIKHSLQVGGCYGAVVLVDVLLP